MTLKNLLCVAVVAALMTSSAKAQSTTAADSAGSNTGGPVFMVDFLRNGDGNPEIDAATGGLTYVISLRPDTAFGTFTGADAGPNGPGGSVAIEIGALLTAGTATGALSDVTVNTTDFDQNNPGNSIFGFETPSGGAGGAFPVGVQVEDNRAASNSVAGVALPAGDAVFAALGSRFFMDTEFSDPTAFVEVLRVSTSALTNMNLTHSLTLTGRGDAFDSGVLGSVIAAQTVDLSLGDNPNNAPISANFTPESVTDTDTFVVGDTNLDGTVDPTDLNNLLFDFGNNGTWAAGNLNGDSIIDPVDLNLLLFEFGNSGVVPVVAGASVPEPTSVAFIALGAGIAVCTRRRR